MKREELSLADLMVFVRRHAAVLVGLSVLGVLLGVAYLFVKTPKYRATATLHLDEAGASSFMGELAAFATLAGGSGAGSEIGILQSRSVAEQVVLPPDEDAVPHPTVEGFESHLGLTVLTREVGMTLGQVTLRGFKETPAFGESLAVPHARLYAAAERVREPAPRAMLIEFLAEDEIECTTPTQWTRVSGNGRDAERMPFTPGTPFVYRGLSVRCIPEGDVIGRKFLVQQLPFQDAVDRLRRYTSVEELGRSSGIIRVSVLDTDPSRAADAANAICNNYLDMSEVKRRRRAAQTIGSIEEMLSQQIEDFEAAQTALITIQQKNPQLINLEASSKAAIDQIAGLEASRMQLVVQQGAFERIVEALDRGDRSALAGLDSALATGLVVDPVTEELLKAVAELSSEYTTLRQKLTDDAPDIAELRDAARDLERQIGDQIRGRIISLEGRIGAIKQEVASVLGSMVAGPGIQKDYLSLLSQVEAQKEVLPLLLRGIMTAEVARLSSSKSAEYLDPAIAPKAFDTPKMGVTLLVGTLVGFAMGLCLAVIAEGRGRRPLALAEFEDLRDVTLLGEVPRADERAVEDAYRALRERLRHLQEGEGASRVVGVTSLTTSHGQASVFLARSLSRAGNRVLLVDGDPEGSGATSQLEGEATSFEMDAGADWRGFVLSDADFDLLLIGDASSRGGDRWSSTLFQPLLAELLEVYDRVVLDLPPLRAGADVLVVSRSLDDLVLFCPAARTMAHELGGVVQRLNRVGAPLRGIVLDGVQS